MLSSAMDRGKVFFLAQNVAAILGRHRYRPPKLVYLETLLSQKGTSFANIQAAMHEDPQIATYIMWNSLSPKNTLMTSSTTQIINHEIRQEKNALNDVAHKENQRVTQEDDDSSLLKLQGEKYVIVGRVNGVLQNGRVVEVKTRYNWLRSPPEYDIVHIRTYLQMLRSNEGLLEERRRHRCDVRSTVVKAWTEDEWTRIDETLNESADTIRLATLDVIRSWLL